MSIRTTHPVRVLICLVMFDVKNEQSHMIISLLAKLAWASAKTEPNTPNRISEEEAMRGDATQVHAMPVVPSDIMHEASDLQMPPASETNKRIRLTSKTAVTKPPDAQ